MGFGFRSIPLKIIPGASDEDVRHTLSLASAVSLNIETAGEANFKRLSHKKNYTRDILGSIQFISRLTARGSSFERVKQTTQFVAGASGEDLLTAAVFLLSCLLSQGLMLYDDICAGGE